MIYTKTYDSPLGGMLLAEQKNALIGVWFEGQKRFFLRPDGEPFEKADTKVLREAGQWLNLYFAGGAPDPKIIPLAPVGSGFCQDVWSVLLQIPYGTAITYGDVAKKLGKDPARYGRAVGEAIGRNPISILIPCHRVIGKNGKLTGYAGGLEKKLWLLEHEKAERKNDIYHMVP